MLNTTYIPSTNKQAQNITLIHGWGADSGVWQDWATHYFTDKYNITLIDLPGSGDSPQLKTTDTLEQDWINALVQVLPEKTHLLGWSLGGLLAQQITLQYPKRITSLVCLASTPRFTQNDGWNHSVSPQIIGDFIKSVSIEINSVLKKFWRLQLQGSDNARALMKKLIEHMSSRKTPKLTSLNQGLTLLRDMDNRKQLKQIKAPTLWLLGEKDPLIPQKIHENLSDLQPYAKIEIIEGGSHVLFFSHPQQTATSLLNFWVKH